MIMDLPKDIQEQVRVSLASGDFLRAKQLHDNWKNQQEKAVQ